MIRKKDIPPSYSLIRKDKTCVVLRDDWKEILLQSGINDPDFFLKRSGEQSDDYYGRSALRIIDLPGEAKGRAVLRHYRRGGRVQKFIKDIYWGKSRPLQELWIGHRAAEKGLPTAEILAACHTKVFWKFHRGDLISKEIVHGKDLATYLAELSQPLSKEDILKKREAAAIVGTLVRKMHDVGIFHGDLNLKNIILQSNESGNISGYIIDFDKSSLHSPLSEKMRVRNLLRLNRSAEKFKKQGLPITRSDVLRFLLAYCQNPSDVKTLLMPLNRQYSRHMRYHRFGTKLLRPFKRDSSPIA
jgi:tRNA A-37 threonylcarbamoyl transferase component Bud32